MNRDHLKSIGASFFALVWQLALYAAVLVGGIVGLLKLLKIMLHSLDVHFDHPDGAHPVGSLLLNQLVILEAAIIATYVLTRTDRARTPAILCVNTRGGIHFLLGVFWGVAGMSILMGLIACFGGYRITGLALSGPSLAGYAALWIGAAAVNGLAENLAILGYPLLRAAKTLGYVPAIFLVSVLFAVAHIGNPGENPLGLVSIFLTAVLFAAATWRTGSLWLPAGIHAGMVLSEDFLFSVPDSGAVYTGHLVLTQFNGPAWLTGGAAGPEGSLLIFPVLIAGLALLYGFGVKRSRFPGGREPKPYD